MGFAYDPKTTYADGNGGGGNGRKFPEGRFGRPIADGEYNAQLVWFDDPDKNDPNAINLNFVIPDQGTKATPEGGVKIDWQLKGGRTGPFLRAFGFDPDKPYSATEISKAVAKAKGQWVKVTVENREGKTPGKIFANITRLAKLDTQPTATTPAATTTNAAKVADDDLPY